jgi:hypothetical protein
VKTLMATNVLHLLALLKERDRAFAGFCYRRSHQNGEAVMSAPSVAALRVRQGAYSRRIRRGCRLEASQFL